MKPDNPRCPGAHGDGCRCLDCTQPEQRYCESCLGPMRHEGGGFFVYHDTKDCIEWLARRERFSTPVVYANCRPRAERPPSEHWVLGDGA